MSEDGWKELDGGLRRRDYQDYEAYLEKQAEKLDRRPGFAKQFSDGFRGSLGQVIENVQEHIPPGGNVLCLGARVGGEVQAFIDHGYFAIGIDVNPGEGNRYVLHGDFHKPIFPDNSIDIVYTNSLDHVLNMKTVARQVYRMLKPGGIFFTENKGGTEEPGFRPARSDAYDCMEWKSLHHLMDFICRWGFRVVHQYRWKGFTPWGIIYQKY